MSTPHMIGRAAILLGALAVLVAIAIGAGIALDLGPWSDPVDRGSTAAFVPARTEGGVVIATADGAPIYLEDARSRVEGLTSMHGNIEETLGLEWPDAVLQSLVEDVLLLEEAEERGVVVTEADIAGSLDRIRGMVGTESTFEEWLAEQETTLPELERQIYRQTLASRVYLAVTEDVAVTEDELRTYYRSHRDEFRTTDGLLQPFFMVREDLSETLLKQREDETYAAWLEAARGEVDLVVIEQGWWRELT